MIAVAATGICSSLPPWMISNGSGAGLVNCPGSFAFSSVAHSGTVFGSALRRSSLEKPDVTL